MLIVWLNIALGIVGAYLWWREDRNGEAIKCFFRGGHDIPKSWLVHDTGALFHGGICRRCMTFWLGPFLCNAWDEEQTVEEDGVHYLHGTNPTLKIGNFLVIGDVELLQEKARELRRLRNMKVA